MRSTHPDETLDNNNSYNSMWIDSDDGWDPLEGASLGIFFFLQWRFDNHERARISTKGIDYDQ